MVDLLSASCDATRTAYRLAAVVYHHGAHAQGGHYTCDVWHPAGEWLRMDDENILTITERQVTDAKSDREPYLLFYQIV